MSNYTLKLGILLLKVLRFCTFILLLITLLGWAAPYVKDAQKFSYINNSLQMDKQLIHVTKQYLPTKIAGYDVSHFINFMVFFIFMGIFGRWQEELRYKTRYQKEITDIEAIKQQYQSAAGAPPKALENLDTSFKKLATADRKEREILLNDFVTLKKRLQQLGRELAFLSIDVVDSTGMKVGEDNLVVTHDFIEYRNFVEAILKNSGMIKASWTPDGVMVCFSTVEQAVTAAQMIISQLKNFNETIKTIKHNFAIRCGINAGYLYFDDTLPLEQITDRVIDIAGHLQKHARANTIALPKNLVKPIQTTAGFIKGNHIVDELEVYEWLPPHSKNLSSNEAPPRT